MRQNGDSVIIRVVAARSKIGRVEKPWFAHIIIKGIEAARNRVSDQAIHAVSDARGLRGGFQFDDQTYHVPARISPWRRNGMAII